MRKYFLFLMFVGCSSDTFTGGDGGDGVEASSDGANGTDGAMSGDGSSGADVITDGGSNGDGADGQTLPLYRRVFITSGDYPPNFGGLAGADGICNSVASGAGLGGTWAAWLSSSKMSAGSRLEHATVPYKLLDGTVVASDWNDLTSGSLQHPIDRDEHDKVVVVSDIVPYSGYAWTGSVGDGGTYVGFGGAATCDDWTYVNDGGMSPYGVTGGSPIWDGGPTGVEWTQGSDFTCKTAPSVSLYCIEQL